MFSPPPIQDEQQRTANERCHDRSDFHDTTSDAGPGRMNIHPPRWHTKRAHERSFITRSDTTSGHAPSLHTRTGHDRVTRADP